MSCGADDATERNHKLNPRSDSGSRIYNRMHEVSGRGFFGCAAVSSYLTGHRLAQHEEESERTAGLEGAMSPESVSSDCRSIHSHNCQNEGW
jgi:hypothetical protein